MGSRKVIAALGAMLLVLVVLACTDTTGPPVDNSLPGDIGLVASVAGDDGGSVVPRILKRSAPWPRLETYTVSFWATRRETRSAVIRYLPYESDDDDDEDDDDEDGYDEASGDTFLSLRIPRRSLKKYDGTKVGKRDSILITITVDPARFLVSLEPSGLQFSGKHPAELFINYAGASRDFDGDGDVDEIDALIETQYLKLWSQAADGPWTPIQFEHSVEDRWFLGWLLHFSDHVISW